VPPLRERPEDFRELVGELLAEAAGEAAGGAGATPVAAGVIEDLRQRPWPGNVRELRNLLQRLRVEFPGRIDREALARTSARAPGEGLFPGNVLQTEPLPALQRRLERDYIAHHYRRLGWDTAALSAHLGLSRRQLYRRCERLGVSLRGIRNEAWR
jgi:DNA-binding NtrC family response regulator